MLKKDSISNLFDITAGGDIKKEKYSIFKKGKFIYPVYSNQLTEKGLYGYYEEYTVDYDSITVTARGMVGHAETRIKEKYMPVGRLLVLKPKKNINLKYIKNIINYKMNFANESTGVPQLTAPQIGKYEIFFLENIEEQNRIADVLTNIDNLMDSLQYVIEKKEKIFEATTQKLLSGEKKKYEWKKVRIGDIGIFEGNGVDKKIREGEKRIRLLNYMDIMNNNFIYSDVSNFFVTGSNEKINKCAVKKGDIFLTPSSETRLDIGISAVAMEDIDDLVYSYHIVRFRPLVDMDLLFRTYMFKNKSFLMQASTMCEGSGKRYVCSNKKFASFELEIPLDVREQKDIANKLYTMEKEIKVLKNKLFKYKQIKKGMLEDLLTGKVRLNYE